MGENIPDKMKQGGQEDTLKGKMKQAAGKIQEKVGEMTGDREAQTQGKTDQVKGKGQSTVGDVKKKVGDAFDPDRDPNRERRDLH